MTFALSQQTVIIRKYLNEFKKANIKALLDKKLPDILNDQQKEDKIKYLLQKMKTEERIKVGDDRHWVLIEK